MEVAELGTKGGRAVVLGKTGKRASSRGLDFFAGTAASTYSSMTRWSTWVKAGRVAGEKAREDGGRGGRECGRVERLHENHSSISSRAKKSKATREIIWTGLRSLEVAVWSLSDCSLEESSR